MDALTVEYLVGGLQCLKSGFLCLGFNAQMSLTSFMPYLVPFPEFILNWKLWFCPHRSYIYLTLDDLNLMISFVVDVFEGLNSAN